MRKCTASAVTNTNRGEAYRMSIVHAVRKRKRGNSFRRYAARSLLVHVAAGLALAAAMRAIEWLASL